MRYPLTRQPAGEAIRCFTTGCKGLPTVPVPHPKAAAGASWCGACWNGWRFHYSLQAGDIVTDKTGTRFTVKHTAVDVSHFACVMSADEIVLFENDGHGWCGGITRVCGRMTAEFWQPADALTHTERVYRALVSPLNPQGWRNLDDPDELRCAHDEWDQEVAVALIIDGADNPDVRADWDSEHDWPDAFEAMMLAANRMDRLISERDAAIGDLDRLRTAQRTFAEELLSGGLPEGTQ